MTEQHSADKIIAILRGVGVNKNKNILNLHGLTKSSNDWTLEEIDTMTEAAAQNTGITHFDITGINRLNHITAVPFIKLLENSPTIKKVSIQSGHFSNQQEIEHFQRIVDTIYHAMIRNRNLPLKEFSISAINGNHQLFHKLLVSSKITSLTLHACTEGISSEGAWALASSLRGMNTLKEVAFEFEFDCVSQASLNHIITSLHNHPTIEKVRWWGDLHYEAFSGLLTLCASCPKIKDVKISHAGYLYSEPTYDIAPLLHGLRFSETLESLKLDCVLIGNVGTVFSSHSNKSIHSLHLTCAIFQGNPLSFLKNFKGLKNTCFEDCTGVFDQNLANLEELEALTIMFDVESEGEADGFKENISEIVSQCPPTVDFYSCCSNVNLRVVQDIVAGLQSRTKPMKGFSLCGSEWEQGTLNLFCTNALPLLLDVEELAINNFQNTTSDGQREACRFIGALSELPKLKKLHLGFCNNPDPATTTAGLKLCEKSDTIEHFWCYEFLQDKSFCDRMNVYTRWNRCGRRLIRDPGIPIGLWPHVLAKVPERIDDYDVVFAFVKSLNSHVNLFKKA